MDLCVSTERENTGVETPRQGRNGKRVNVGWGLASGFARSGNRFLFRKFGGLAVLLRGTA